MNQKIKQPLWVELAFANIKTRRAALYLVYGCAIFSAYCFPWASYFGQSKLVYMLFLIQDWSWFVVCSISTLWYWLCIRWMDKNTAWAA